MADPVAAATLPAALEAALVDITAAIHPAIHSALAQDLQTQRVGRLAAIACYE